MNVTRRGFITSSGVALAASAFGGNVFERALAAGEPEAVSGLGRVLVVIQLAGGNDGLNTIVPYSDPQYRKLRPTVGLDEIDLLKVDDRLAFHSAMGSLKERFSLGQVAVVEGVGYPKPDRSHFVSTAIWQTARLEPYREPAGWIGRTLDAVPATKLSPELPALGIGGGGLTPALYAVKNPIPSLLSLDAFTVQPDRRYPADAPALRAALDTIYSGASSSTNAMDFTRHVGQVALKSSDSLRAAVNSYSSKVSYPRGAFGDQLKLTAQLLVAHLPIRVFHLTLGGFDTHANQKNQQRNLLAQIADGISALLDDLKAHGESERVAVLTYSEFGRRAAENGSAGTDHGAASQLFVVGEKVAGAVFGPTPPLDRLENGDLPMAIDFREVYASVLRDWLAVSPEKILGSGFKPLSLFRA